MKEFIVYTLMRLLLFVGSLLVVWLVWALVTDGQVPAFYPLLIAFIVSGVLSYFLLNPQREALAKRVDERARNASSKFEERRAREDAE